MAIVFSATVFRSAGFGESLILVLLIWIIKKSNAMAKSYNEFLAEAVSGGAIKQVQKPIVLTINQ